jgi:hypothetical protein
VARDQLAGKKLTAMVVREKRKSSARMSLGGESELKGVYGNHDKAMVLVTVRSGSIVGSAIDVIDNEIKIARMEILRCAK